MAAKYELILQFALAPRDVAQFDRVTQVEAELSKPSMLFQLDGHDCTCGRIEIRLFTDDPPRSFEVIREIIPRRCEYRAGYRLARTEEALVGLPA